MDLSLPEPLQTAAHGAGQMMAMGAQGTATKGSSTADYAKLCAQHEDDLLPFLREVVEHTSRRMAGNRSVTLRPASKALFDRRHHGATLLLATCPPDSPEQVTECGRGVTLFAIRASSEPGLGLIVDRCS